MDYGPVRELFAVGGAADPAAEMVRRLRDPGDASVLLRERLAYALELKNTEHNAQGTELDQRYRSSAVLPDPTAAEEVFARDPLLYLQATTRLGAKIPHVWLTDEDGRGPAGQWSTPHNPPEGPFDHPVTAQHLEPRASSPRRTISSRGPSSSWT